MESGIESEEKREVQSRFGLLEIALLVAMHFLLYQLVPSSAKNLESVFDLMDFTQWSRTTWFIANFVFVALLASVRFGPSLAEEWSKRQKRLTSEREKAEEIKKLEEQREMLKRIEEGRRRRTI